MTGKTHLTSGIALSLLLTQDFVSAILICVGSILPDIDHNNSTLGKVVPILPKIFKHRGILHSIWIPIILFFISRPLCYGYALHLLLDIITVQGLKLFYPIDFTLKGFIKTGGWLEYVIFGLLLLSSMFMIFRNYILPLFSTI